jgi:hypothetical protein
MGGEVLAHLLVPFAVEQKECESAALPDSGHSRFAKRLRGVHG